MAFCTENQTYNLTNCRLRCCILGWEILWFDDNIILLILSPLMLECCNFCHGVPFFISYCKTLKCQTMNFLVMRNFQFLRTKWLEMKFRQSSSCIYAYFLSRGCITTFVPNGYFLLAAKTALTIFFIFGRCLVLVEGYLST